MTEVLIVDDEVALLELLRDVVEDLGCEVLCALDGQEALRILSESIEPPAVLITDRMMPVINGLQLINIVRKMPGYDNVPIILMSTAADKHTSPLVDAFITKPFDLDEFAAVVSHFLSDSKELAPVSTKR